MFKGNHPDVAMSLFNMGGFYYNLAMYDAALRYLTRALAMRKALFDADHPAVVESLQYVEDTKGELAKQVGARRAGQPPGWGALGMAVAVVWQWQLPAWVLVAFRGPGGVAWGSGQCIRYCSWLG